MTFVPKPTAAGGWPLPRSVSPGGPSAHSGWTRTALFLGGEGEGEGNDLHVANQSPGIYPPRFHSDFVGAFGKPVEVTWIFTEALRSTSLSHGPCEPDERASLGAPRPLVKLWRRLGDRGLLG